MKKIRVSLSVILTVLILFTSAVGSHAWSVDKTVWDTAWAGSEEKIGAAVTMIPGKDDTERCIFWYGDSDDGELILFDSSGSAIAAYDAPCVKTPQGDYRFSLRINNLNPQQSYSYTCSSGDWTSEKYEIPATSSDSFTAVYVSDIHISYDENNADSLRDDSYYFNETLTAAYNKALSRNSSLGLILSAGDQASDGLRVEYEALVANDFVKSIPFAPCIGNHDMKSADYKFFNPQQPGTVDMSVKNYIGTDYSFVKGDALFMIIDSNNLSMADHYKFVKKATEDNPDVKWRIAVFHHDLYSARLPSRESENQFLRLMWAPIADEFGFDLCLLGHSHYYSISNVMYNNKTVSATENGAVITNPEGTVYMVTGSINNPRGESDELGLSENIGHAVITEEKIYNLLDFSEESIVINSYTIESDQCIGSLTIKKTSNEGGHSYSTPAAWYYPLVKVISGIAAVIYNIGRYYDNTQLGFNIPFFEGIFG